MENLDDLAMLVLHLEDSEVRNGTVEGEAHRTFVRVLLSVNTAVTMGAAMVVNSQVILDTIISAGNDNVEPEVHALFPALGQQQPLWVTTAATLLVRQLSAVGHSLVSVVDQLREGHAVRDGHRRLGGLALDFVVSRMHCNMVTLVLRNIFSINSIKFIYTNVHFM